MINILASVRKVSAPVKLTLRKINTGLFGNQIPRPQPPNMVNISNKPKKDY